MSRRTAPRTPSPPPPASEKTFPKPSHANRNLNKHRMMMASKKAKEAFELHLAGWGWNDIAVKQGYANRSGAWLAAERWMLRLVQVPAEKVRRIEVERLRELLKTLWPKATAKRYSKGKLEAIDRVLRIMQRLARLLGLDMPNKVALTDPSGEKAYEAVVIYVPQNNREST